MPTKEAFSETGYPNVFESGFFNPAHYLEAADVFRRDKIQLVQKALDRHIETKGGEKGQIGELARVVHWDGETIWVATFDFVSGQQVGLGQAEYSPDPKFRDVAIYPKAFITGFVIGSNYEGRGLGFLTRQFLKTFLASQFNEGIFLFSQIQALGRHQRAAERILQKSGAMRNRRLSEMGAGDWWVEFVPNPGRPIPQSLPASNVILRARKRRRKPEFGDQIDQKGRVLIYRGVEIAEIRGKEIRFLAPPDENIEYWPGVNLIWLEAKKLGFSPILRF